MSDVAMEAWKARGRELNALYAVLSPAVGQRSSDPVADLQSLVAERDRYREALAVLADEDNWSSNPHSHDAVLFGHDTPFELAVAALNQLQA